jgi:hypothetical protein
VSQPNRAFGSYRFETNPAECVAATFVQGGPDYKVEVGCTLVPPKAKLSLAYRQSPNAAARHLGRSVNMAGQAACMGAYLSAVQSACYGAVWAHRRHGRAHGGPPPNNGNRGRWCASANLIQETNVPAGSLLPSHARLQPVSAGCARETHGLRPRFVSMFACLPAGALDDACATAAAHRSPGPRGQFPLPVQACELAAPNRPDAHPGQGTF